MEYPAYKKYHFVRRIIIEWNDKKAHLFAPCHKTVIALILHGGQVELVLFRIVVWFKKMSSTGAPRILRHKIGQLR